MLGKVITIGEILVEIMAVSPGYGFREAVDLVGPFPSGAPAIFIDQMAKQGHPASIIGCVGNDDFGWLNMERLRRDGVDVSAIAVEDDEATGSAFVRYRPDGQRDFVFNIRHSASRRICLTEAARAAIAGASHLHVVGSSLVSPAIIATVMFALDAVKERGGTVSFDPNIRKEMLGASGLRDALTRVLTHTDLFLPSGSEVLMFSDQSDEQTAMRELLARGVSTIVHKQGAVGARYLSADADVFSPAFAVAEVDPTGAGDAFGATCVAGWLQGLAPFDNLRRANAAGALAVGRRGPMEGTSTSSEITSFLAAQS